MEDNSVGTASARLLSNGDFNEHDDERASAALHDVLRRSSRIMDRAVATAAAHPLVDDVHPLLLDYNDDETEIEDPQKTLKRVVFGMICFLCFTFSGGVLLGVGPLMIAMKAQGFLILTWGSVVVTLILPSFGPRVVATLGALVSGCGCAIFWQAPPESESFVFMIGFGLAALGMNAFFISIMNGLTGILEKPGSQVSILSGLFNAAGVMLLVWVCPSTLNIKVSVVFQIYTFYSAFMVLVALVVFPPTPYSSYKNTFRFCWAPWSLRQDEDEAKRRAQSMSQHASFAEVLQDSVQSLAPENPVEESTGFYELTFMGALRKPRYWWFAYSFSWSTVIAVYIGGTFNDIALNKSKSNAVDISSYAYPLIGNMGVALWAPLVGYMASRYGLWTMALGMIVSGQVMCIGCYIPGQAGLYVILFGLAACNAFTYSLQFTYITVAFPTALYCPLLALTIAIQGVFNLIDWPILSPIGIGVSGSDYKTVITGLFVGSVISHFFPYIQYRNDRYRMNFLNMVLAHQEGVEGYGNYAIDGHLGRMECTAMVVDMFKSLGVRHPSDEQVSVIVDILLESLGTDQHSPMDAPRLRPIDEKDITELASSPAKADLREKIVKLIRAESPHLKPSFSQFDRD